MPHVSFTPNLSAHIDCPPGEAAGTTVREVLDAVFAENERARSYVLDDQGAVRHHMVIFVNGQAVRDRERLTDPVAPEDEVYIMQALSGG